MEWIWIIFHQSACVIRLPLFWLTFLGEDVSVKLKQTYALPVCLVLSWTFLTPLLWQWCLYLSHPRVLRHHHSTLSVVGFGTQAFVWNYASLSRGWLFYDLCVFKFTFYCELMEVFRLMRQLRLPSGKQHWTFMTSWGLLAKVHQKSMQLIVAKQKSL